jgi:ankyrin repeat protein
VLSCYIPLFQQAGSDPDELHPTEGFAPLHAAVSSEASRTEVIRLLLAAGADVNLLRSANPIWSPLMYAATRGSLEHLQLLLGELCLLPWGGRGWLLVWGLAAPLQHCRLV